LKDFERSFKEALEVVCEHPLKKREVKKLLLTLFECLFEELSTNGHFIFPKGYGSLRIKQSKPFKMQKASGEEIEVPSSRVIRYYPGRLIKRRINNV
jgi:nucleoid DNA-binding protein